MAYFTDSVYERMMTQRPRYRQENETPALKKKNVSNYIDDKLKYRKLIILPKEGSEKQ
ncbi:hypothetical protein AAGC94_09345 [Clostridium sporogenes]|uniref:hypothetical protein n=1 Tax=Clostridium sporogenes TaxID=1509 RepID=UPI00313EDF8E